MVFGSLEEEDIEDYKSIIELPFNLEDCTFGDFVDIYDMLNIGNYSILKNKDCNYYTGIY